MSESWRQNQALVDDDKPVAAVVEGDWDDSEDEEVTPPPPQKPAAIAKPAAKAPPKKQALVTKAPESAPYVEPTPEQVAAEIKASRLADAEDLFGLNEKEERKAKKLDEQFDELSLSTEDDYRSFAGLVVSRIEVEKRGNHKRMTFLKEVLKASSAPLSAEEVNELKSVLNVVFNEKKKAQTSKKKPKKAGKSLKVGGLEDDLDNGQVFEDDY